MIFFRLSEPGQSLMGENANLRDGNRGSHQEIDAKTDALWKEIVQHSSPKFMGGVRLFSKFAKAFFFFFFEIYKNNLYRRNADKLRPSQSHELKGK